MNWNQVVRGVLVVSLALALGVWGVLPTGDVAALSTGLVISQVYGGGGNASAPYQNDFIELFNRGDTSINVTGWSVQYAPATSTSWSVTLLAGSIAPGQYYLVQEAAGTGCSGAPCGVALPTPDATGTIIMNAIAGKVALVNTTTALSGACPTGAQIVDFVGYGTTADCYEGAGRAPAPSNTTAAIRGHQGYLETDNNSTDLAAGAPTPRSKSTFSMCASQASGNWSSVGTWACGFVPYLTQAVNVLNSHLVTIDTGAQARSLGVEHGGALQVNNAGSLTVTDVLTNNGVISQTKTVTGTTDVGFVNTGGYGGVIINANNTGAGVDPGITTVAIYGNQPCDTGNSSVNRCFRFTPQFDTGLDATVTFFYSGAEATLIGGCATGAYRWVPGSGWAPAGVPGASDCLSVPQVVTMTNVTHFSWIVLAGEDVPTVIRLSTLDAVTGTPVWPVAAILMMGMTFFAAWVWRRRK